MYVCSPHCGERCRVLRPRYLSRIYLYSFILSYSLILYYIYYFLLLLTVRRAPTRAIYVKYQAPSFDTLSPPFWCSFPQWENGKNIGKFPFSHSPLQATLSPPFDAPFPQWEFGKNIGKFPFSHSHFSRTRDPPSRLIIPNGGWCRHLLLCEAAKIT